MAKEADERDRGRLAVEDEPTEHLLILLLVPNQTCADRLASTLSGRVESEDIRIDVVSEQAADAVGEARKKVGGQPLGFVAEDEIGALEALGAGADEVMVWPPRDDGAIQGFFDRTKLRAKLRKGQERLNVSIAHAEKLTALGTLVAGVAHEINNPLTVLQFGLEAYTSLWTPLIDVAGEVRTRAQRNWGMSAEEVHQLAQRSESGAPPHEAKQLLEEMLSAVTSIANIVRDLRIFARSDGNQEEAQLLDANEAVDQALRLVGRQFGTATRIERDYARDLPKILVPQGRLSQVLVNVLVNAAHAIREVQRPVHRLRVVTRSDGEQVAISISDTGPGIAPHTLDQIFDPFFTTKRAGYGTGLGLSISRSIMHDLGGDLIVESVHGSGATFILLLPIPDYEAVRSAYLRSNSIPASVTAVVPRRTVLLVDDDEHVLSAYARALGRSYDVLMAADGREAIDLLSSGSSADALVSELELPELDGRELFEWVRRDRPELASRAVFVSTDATLQRFGAFVRSLENPVLVKPVTASALLSALSSVLQPKSAAPPPHE